MYTHNLWQLSIVPLLINTVLAPSCQQLIDELLKDEVVCQYKQFAVHLGLEPATVECITMSCGAVPSPHWCLINVINHWVDNHDVSWQTVTKALDCIGCQRMAEEVQLKYSLLKVCKLLLW